MRQGTRKWIKRGAALGIVACVGGLVAFPAVFPDARFASGLSVRDASCDGVPCSVRVYRGPNAWLLVKVDQNSFSIDPRTRRVGGANSQALVPLPVGALYREEQIGGVTLGDGVKSETDPRLEIRDGVVSFVDAFKGRIRFTLPG